MTHVDPSVPGDRLNFIAKALAPVETSVDQTVVRRKSRDFFWFSPILNEALNSRFGDIVAMPSTVDELRHCLSVAWERDMPVVPRGGDTARIVGPICRDGADLLVLGVRTAMQK